MEYLEYDLTKEDPFKNYDREIDNLDFNKTSDGETDLGEKSILPPKMCKVLRNVLHEIREVTTKIGGKVLKVGKRVLDFIFKAIARFPRTACGILILACIKGLVSSIPLVGQLFSAIIAPLGVIFIGVTLITEYVNYDPLKEMMASFTALFKKAVEAQTAAN